MDYHYKYNKYKTKYLKSKMMQEGGKYMSNITIIKELGKGMHGTVYLVKDIYNNEYAMKVEQILEKDMIETSKSYLWREIDFANTLSNKYPNQFMKIYKYENKKCDYVHTLTETQKKSLNEEAIKYYNELNESHYCSIKLTSTIDDILENIIYKLSDKKIILDLLIQVVYIAYLINKEGYYHRDFHPENIGVVYTKDEFIEILKNKIPTHGYILQAIDYGMVLHKKYQLDESEKNALTYNNDLYRIFYKIIFKIMLKKLIERYPNININKKISISENDSKVLEPYLKNIKINNSDWVNKNYNYFQQLLYKIVFFDKFQDQLGIIDKIELFDFISVKSVIFIVINFYDLKKILKHLIEITKKSIKNF